jgi:hypothetical protein
VSPRDQVLTVVAQTCIVDPVEARDALRADKLIKAP